MNNVTVRDRTDSPRTMWLCYPSGYAERYERTPEGVWISPCDPGADNGMIRLQTVAERAMSDTLTDADLDRLWEGGA